MRHEAVRNAREEALATPSKDMELLQVKLAMTEAMLSQERENSRRQQETVEDGTVAVVFAALGTEGVSVISMRPASAKERSLL